MKQIWRLLYGLIPIIALIIAAYAPFGVSVWSAYVLGTEVLKLSQRHAILLALLPIIWIHLLGSYFKEMRPRP